MKALSIINGVVDEQVHGDIERYAQLLGFLSYEPEGALDGAGRSSRIALACADTAGLETYKSRVSEMHRAGCPVILIPTADSEENPGSYRKIQRIYYSTCGIQAYIE